MMKRLSILITLGLLLCTTPPAQAQQRRSNQMIAEARSSNRTTDARVLFNAWRALQRQNSRNVQRISLVERLNSRFEGPVGTWRSTVDMSVSGYLTSNNWQNSVTRILDEGRSVPRNEWNSIAIEWRSLLGEFAPLIEDPAFPLQLFENMTPSGKARAERIDGEPHWRIEMVPSRGGGPYQRVTLWVHQEVGYLSRSRAVATYNRSSIDVITDYKRLNGIDVPVRRYFEGKVQQRRRTRVSTLFFAVQGDYTNYLFR